MNKIKKVETYDIEINGKIHKGFKIHSEWEGLTCYKNTNGKVIAVKHKSILDDILNLNGDDTAIELNVILAAPFFQGKCND